MIRRPLRPHFGSDDKQRLIEAIGEARDYAIKCRSAAPFDSPLQQKCDAVTEISTTLPRS